MKNTLVLLATMVLAACAAPAAAPTQVAEALPPTLEPIAPTAAPTDASPPFEAATFVDAEGRFSFQYPASWTVLGGEAGSRGQYVQIASWDPGDAPVESLPRGESQLQVAVYQWDPKGDLDARLDMRRTAFINSGIQIVEETVLPLATGPDGVRMLLHYNGEEILQYFFLLGDEYLEFTALGDFQVIDEAIATFMYGSR
ncbi:MAG: hypothetical protein KIS88_02905 [Anaerolineales bacterium]|nr:hypothetical protein [Anaerolineales bacterium]